MQESLTKQIPAALSQPGLSREAVEALSAFKGEPEWMLRRRLEAWRVYEDTPMPTTNDEDWRRTDIRPLKIRRISSYAPAETVADARSLVPAEMVSELGDAGQGGLMIQVNSEVAYRNLDDELAARGVIFTDMDTAVREYRHLVEPYFMTRAVPPTHNKFAALNGALWSGGTFLYVPRRVEITLPLHSIVWGTVSEKLIAPHVLVVLDEQAQATVINEVASPTLEGQGMVAGAVELFVGNAARLTYVTLQSYGRNVFNFTTERARVGRDAQLDWIIGSTGSRLTKSYLELELDGQGSTGKMSGFYFTDGNQHLDHDTQQNHNAPATTSDFLFKGALKDESRSVWEGMIRAAPGAIKTDGYQANRNLILSEKARADSIPGLEIMADDLRCTHGATAGQIDEDEVFYLMARGIPRREAEKLIVDGFFIEVLERIPFQGLRERLRQVIAEKMGA